MPKPPEFDLDQAHQYFSAHCFNQAWDLIDKQNRTPEEDQQMILLNLASMWHWTQRKDHTPTNLSIGYWQAARIYAILGQAENARRYGELCLQAAKDETVQPFYLAYAYEALARADMVAGNRERMAEYLHMARQITSQVTAEDDRDQLEDDLETIR